MKKKQQISHPEYQISIKFEKTSATYKPQEIVSGNIIVAHASENDFKLDINSMGLQATGMLNVQSKNNNKLLESISTKVDKIKFIEVIQTDLIKNKTLTASSKTYFKFKLEQKDHVFQQTYIGVYFSIVYEIVVDIKLHDGRTITGQIPFFVQVNGAGRNSIEGPFQFPKPKNFMITNTDILGDVNKIPKFKVKGEISSEICQFVDDFNGFLIVDIAQTPIRSIDLQMLRCEKIESPTAGKFYEKTEIQLIQICDGNVTKNIEIPIYMIFPRYFSCPSVKYREFSVDFQVNLVIIFKDGFKVTVNLPIKIIRN